MVLAAAVLMLSGSSVPARAMEVFSAHAFLHSIGSNSHFGYGLMYDQKFLQVKKAIGDLGLRNLRAKVTRKNAAQLRELYACCRVRVVARIDPRIGSLDINPVEPGRIDEHLDNALLLGRDAIAAFEGPNEYTAEQNGPGWDDDLRSYTSRLYTVIRSERKLPHPIVGPTIYLTDPQHVAQLGNISKFVDAWNVHVYPRGYEPTTPIVEQLMQTARQMAPDKPGWVTEYGYHNTTADPSSNPVSELAAAKYLPRATAILFKRSPRGKYYFYELVDGGTNKAGREDNFGLLRYDISRKPAYHTLQRLLARLATATPGITPRALDVTVSKTVPGISSLLLQKSANTYQLLLWQEVRSWDRTRQKDIRWPDKAVTVTLGRSARYTVYDTLPVVGDPARSAPPITYAGGRRSLTVDVPDHIVIVEMELL